jgi:hypothetical protein
MSEQACGKHTLPYVVNPVVGELFRRQLNKVKKQLRDWFKDCNNMVPVSAKRLPAFLA